MNASPRRAAKRRRQQTAYRLLCAKVDKRDGLTCRVCRRYVGPREAHHHHIVFRSRGGADTTGNLVRVCVECHADIHGKRLAVSGDADGHLEIVRTR